MEGGDAWLIEEQKVAEAKNEKKKPETKVKTV